LTGENQRASRVELSVRTIYNIFFTTFFLLASPYYFWRMRRRGNWLDGFFQRFGSYDV
jgi:3-deoxy-D-manno-octulosonic-acid transferase